MKYNVKVEDKIILANPVVMGEGIAKKVFFMGKDKDSFYVIE